jgi:hypothetical protein
MRYAPRRCNLSKADSRPRHRARECGRRSIIEAQAAIELEVSAALGVDVAYPFDIVGSEPWQIDMRPAIQAIVRDVLARRPAGFVSAAFHNTVPA